MIGIIDASHPLVTEKADGIILSVSVRILLHKSLCYRLKLFQRTGLLQSQLIKPVLPDPGKGIGLAWYIVGNSLQLSVKRTGIEFPVPIGIQHSLIVRAHTDFVSGVQIGYQIRFHKL